MKDFVKMCATIGGMKDYVQGGGGNASCKRDGKMAIKRIRVMPMSIMSRFRNIIQE